MGSQHHSTHARGTQPPTPLRIRGSEHSQLSRSRWAPRSSRSRCLEGTASRSPGFRSPAGPGPPQVLDNRQGTSEGRPDEGWPTPGVSPAPQAGPSALEGSEEPGCGAGGVCAPFPPKGTDSEHGWPGTDPRLGRAGAGSTWAGVWPEPCLVPAEVPGTALSSLARGLGVKKRKAPKTVLKAS